MILRRCLSPAIVAVVALHFACQWPAQYQAALARTLPDTGIYLSIAQHLRHGQLLDTWGPAPRPPLFPPGYPLMLAVWPIPGVGGMMLLSCLLFLGTLLLVKRAAGILPMAALASLAFLAPKELMAPMSDSAFLFVLALILAVRGTAASGTLAGFAALIRPEGMLLIPLAAALRRRWQVAAVGLLVLAPYLLWLRVAFGSWMLSPKSAYNSSRAPYLAARVPWKDIHLVIGPDQQALPVEVGAVRYHRKTALIRRLESPLARIPANLSTYWEWVPREPLLLLIGLLGLPVLAVKDRRRFWLALACIPLALPWLLYFTIGTRALFPAFLAAAIGWSALAALMPAARHRPAASPAPSPAAATLPCSPVPPDRAAAGHLSPTR